MLGERKTRCHYSQVLININSLCINYTNAKFTWEFSKSRILQSRNEQNIVPKATERAEYWQMLSAAWWSQSHQALQAMENVSSRTLFKTSQFSPCPEIISSHSLPLPLNYRGRILRLDFLGQGLVNIAALQQPAQGRGAHMHGGTHTHTDTTGIIVQCTSSKKWPFLTDTRKEVQTALFWHER